MAQDVAQRFLVGLADQLALPLELLDQPGTTVAGRPDRADTAMALCYRVGPSAVIWTDPALEDRFGALASATSTVSAEEFAAYATNVGLSHLSDAAMRVLPSGDVDVPARPQGYGHLRLTNDDVARVRAFTEQCTPDDVEEAALDELDEFDEVAINVLTPQDASALVAYASGGHWDWDSGFADMGVLVHPDHRLRGLGRWVVAQATADLLAAGSLPLYRHDVANSGSGALSASLGFEMVTWLQAYRLAE